MHSQAVVAVGSGSDLETINWGSGRHNYQAAFGSDFKKCPPDEVVRVGDTIQACYELEYVLGNDFVLTLTQGSYGIIEATPDASSGSNTLTVRWTLREGCVHAIDF